MLLVVASVCFVGCTQQEEGVPYQDPTDVRIGELLSEIDAQKEETQQAIDYADDLQGQVDDLEAENEDLRAQIYNEHAPSQSAADAAILDEAEWRDGLLTANQFRNGQMIQPGYFNNFVEALKEDNGIYWSALEQQQFVKRFKAWLSVNG